MEGHTSVICMISTIKGDETKKKRNQKKKKKERRTT